MKLTSRLRLFLVTVRGDVMLLGWGWYVEDVSRYHMMFMDGCTLC